jgi:hypothetical protein
MLEYFIWVSPSAGLESSWFPSVFSGVFTAKEVDGLGDKQSGDTQRLMYRHSWRPF